MYITVEPIKIKYSFSEPMYDDHPDLGFISYNRLVTLPIFTGIDVTNNGQIQSIDTLLDSGVSIHEGKITYQTNLLNEIGNSILYIAEEEYETLLKRQTKYESAKTQLFLIEHSMDGLQDQIHDLLNSNELLDEHKYQQLSDSLMKHTTEYISVLSEVKTYKMLVNNILEKYHPPINQEQTIETEIDELDR